MHPVIMLLMGICLLILIWSLFQDVIIKLVLRGIIGGILIVVINTMCPEYAIGINEWTVGCSGILGIPGLITLYALKLLI